MKRLYQLSMMLIFVVAMSTMSLAQPPQMRNGFRRTGNRQFRLLRLLHDKDVRAKLGVTDEQAVKLEAAFMNSAKTSIKDGADLRIQRLELENLMTAAHVDRAQVDQKINEISALQTALMKNRIDTQLTVKETLTPDQLTKIREWRMTQARRFMRQRMQMRPGMMMRRNGPGMGPGMGPRGPQTPPPTPPNPGNGDGQ